MEWPCRRTHYILVHCLVARRTNKLRQSAHRVARPKRRGEARQVRLTQHNEKGFTNYSIVYI